MPDNNYPRLYRGGDPARRRDDATGWPQEESELEQTSIRPHKVSDQEPKGAATPTPRGDKDSSKKRRESSTSRSSRSRDDAKKKTGTRRESRGASAPKHAAGAGSRLDRSFRRCTTLTIASTLLPGLGLAGARQRWAKILGVLLPVGFLGGLIWLAVRAVMNPERAIGWVLRPGLLRGALVVLIITAVGWACLIALTHLITRPKGLTTTKRAIGAGLVIALTFVVSAPLAVGARYTLSQLQLLGSITGDDVTAGSRPNIDTNAENPWKDTPRLNILLLGADSTGTRIKDAGNSVYTPRTDTIMVASIDTTTGDTTLIQIPRNLKYTPFPEGSKLAQLFPRGFRGTGDEAEWYVNALWEKTVAGDHPDMIEALGTPTPTYPGAEALKQGIEGITGLHMHYFALVNIDGLERLINAMGGVRLNVNRKLPIGGDHQTGKRPHGWVQPGENQLLDGYNAMWYARSRFDSDDYDRMARQSCLVNAVIKQADPLTMLTRYEGIAQASSDMVMTDIPQEVLALVAQLAVKVKDASVSRLAFVDGQNGFVSANPDFTLTRTRVHDAITPPTHTNEPTTTTPPEQPSAPPTAAASTAEQVTNACAYNPQE
ncbi:LCP family protein [Arachnia propionica]|uniref:LCP family protein n=1 Tax=Arachnia propionica TaxID=1750 RepID=UPI0030CC15D8